MNNRIDFKICGRFALFTDPVTRIGGEKCSYHLPTYEALKGVVKSIYWKPTFIWYIDKARIMNKIRTQSKTMKPVNYSGIYPSKKDPSKKKETSFHTLSIYTYLVDVEYQVQAHFEWNLYRPELEQDRIDGKHFKIAQRMVMKGGRQDIFLGTRECQGYVEPCVFGEGVSYYENENEPLSYGLMFHGFDYPDETGKNELCSRFWQHPKIVNGVIEFPQPQDGSLIRKFVRVMMPKPPQSVGLEEEGLQYELAQ